MEAGAARPWPTLSPLWQRFYLVRSQATSAATVRNRFARQILRHLLPPSPPAEKATARQDEARQSGTDNGAGDRRICHGTAVRRKKPYTLWASAKSLDFMATTRSDNT